MNHAKVYKVIWSDSRSKAFPLSALSAVSAVKKAADRLRPAVCIYSVARAMVKSLSGS
jgi:uncharacterized membrane protein